MRIYRNRIFPNENSYEHTYYNTDIKLEKHLIYFNIILSRVKFTFIKM